jgi:hypothetical protein
MDWVSGWESEESSLGQPIIVNFTPNNQDSVQIYYYNNNDDKTNGTGIGIEES